MRQDIVCLPILPEECEWDYVFIGENPYPHDINVRNICYLTLVAWVQLDDKTVFGWDIARNTWDRIKTETAQQGADYLSAQLFVGNWETRR